MLRPDKDQDEIIDVRPCSLVGAAATLRQEYIRKGFMTEDKALRLYNPATGEYDIARPLTDDERVLRRLERAKTLEQKRRIAKSERAKKEARRKREWRRRKNITDPPVLREI
jgi:hypothetical protein